MKRKSGKPKAVSYELIDPHGEIGKPLYALLTDLMERHHEDLCGARIALAWCTSWKPDVDGRVTLGKCRKASDLDRELAAYDFVILLAREFFEDLRVTDEQRRALIDHELCHAAVKYDAQGEPVLDARGRTVYRLRKHDLEEFAQIAERYGCWKRDLEQFASALERARQKPLAYWVGVDRLREVLLRAGLTIPLDIIGSWSQAERVEAEAWAVLRQEVTDSVAPQIAPPAHVAAAGVAQEALQ